MSNKIAICLTTFMNNSQAEKVIDSIQPQLSNNCILLVADQNKPEERLKNKEKWKYTFIYYLPFDCGLSFTRNFLVLESKSLNLDFCFITSDNIYFTQQYDFQRVIDFMLSDSNIGIVGFDIHYFWMYNLAIEDNAWIRISVNEQTSYNNITYRKFDLIPNFFLAKTNCLLENKWDNELKMSEHLDFFWRIKINTNWKVYYTDFIKAKRIPCREGEYAKYRKRHLTNEFRSLAWKKYGLTHGDA